LTPEIYESINTIPGALWGVNRLRVLKSLPRVIFVTSNFGNSAGAKFNTLNRLGFNVSKKDYLEVGDKSLVVCDYLVDDNYENVTSTYGTGILFNKPWNKMENYSPRVFDWADIVEYFEEVL
jgi:5'(3')-deoxyribonucleotidase